MLLLFYREKKSRRKSKLREIRKQQLNVVCLSSGIDTYISDDTTTNNINTELKNAAIEMQMLDNLQKISDAQKVMQMHIYKNSQQLFLANTAAFQVPSQSDSNLMQIVQGTMMVKSNSCGNIYV